MAKSLSIDLRERVIAVIDGGVSRRQAAARFGVSVSAGMPWSCVRATPPRSGKAATGAWAGSRRMRG